MVDDKGIAVKRLLPEKRGETGRIVDISLVSIAVGILLLTLIFISSDRLAVSAIETKKASYDRHASCASHDHPSPTDKKSDAPQWEYIVIHHSATSAGSAGSFDQYHKQTKKWADGLAYHFVIGNGNGSGDGTIERGVRWAENIPGPHTRNVKFNARSIAICLVGNFNDDRPSQKQVASLTGLIKNLQRVYAISDDHVLVHGDVQGNMTACPGKNLTTRIVRSWLTGKKPQIAVASR